MNIYTPIPITESLISKFKPCRLYIKELAGIKYFGKTLRDPYKYTGSGVIWNDRIKKYGKDQIKTIWVSEWFYDPASIQDYALSFSRDNQIVESLEWANLRAENGIDGGIFVNPGYKGSGIKSAETKRKMGISAGGTKESIAKGNATKRQNGIDITRQLNTEEARTKSKQTCNKLADREIVKQLRDIAFKSRKKLGSGWVRKPDSWILAQIELISSSHTLES
jgi:hypothetical protein